MKPIYLFFLVLFISCQNQDQQQNLVKENMILELLHSELVLEMKNRQNKIFFYKNDYCEKIDCKNYFKDYVDELRFIEKEDAFIMGLNNWLEITKIDESKGIIEAQKRKIWKRKK